MANPFFSIVIPTKNRPDFLRDTISSVVLQDFDDYELIVSDNFNDERTKKVIDEFKDNKNIKYIRTEREMNIPDHWEFATRKINGDYLLILTDRSFLRQGALRDIYQTIRGLKDAPVVFWNYGYYDEKSKILSGENNEPGVKLLKSEDLAKNFIRTSDARYLPRPHVGCYKTDIIKKIKEKIGHLYLPFGPDYTSSFLALAYSDNVAYIPRPLVFFQGASVSAGTKAKFDVLPYLESLKDPDIYKFVPIKAPIISNLIFNDFLKIKNAVGGSLKDADIDWGVYFAICYGEMMEKKMIPGADRTFLNGLSEEWERALSLLDEKTKRSARKEVRRRYKNIIKSYIKETWPGHFLVRTKRILYRKPTQKYDSFLKAGGF
jgi:glycosyltransferase involved in cell wall biosynthesis